MKKFFLDKNILYALIWSIAFIYIFELLHLIQPGSLTFFRFSFAFIILIVIAIYKKINIFKKKYLSKSFIFPLIKGSIIYFVYTYLYHITAQYIPVINYTALCAMTPLFFLVIENFTEGKLISFRDCFFITIVTISAIIMIDDLNKLSELIYYMIAFIIVFLWSLYCKVSTIFLKKYNSIVIGIYQTFFIMILSFPFLFFEKNVYSLSLNGLSMKNLFYLFFISFSVSTVYLSSVSVNVNSSNYTEVVKFYSLTIVFVLILLSFYNSSLLNIKEYISLILNLFLLIFIFIRSKMTL